MSTHHGRVLLETAQGELDRVHRAAIAADAGELRRGLDLAVAALREALPSGLDAETSDAVGAVLARLETAQADLDSGALVEMALLVEEARTSLALV